MKTKPWHQAAIDGDEDTVDRLLAQGQEVDHRDRHGQTALMLAARHGRGAVVDRLIAHGAALDHTAKFGLSALMLAIVNRHPSIAQALLSAGADTTLLGTGAPGFAGKDAGDLAREAGLSSLAEPLALDSITRAFSDRSAPVEMTDSMQLSDIEHDEVMSFSGMRWQDIPFQQIADNSDAVFWFAPEAFCYYLPGFMAAGLREHRTDTNAYDALIGMLDRSPEPEYWDDFFAPRWTRLTARELRATRAWVDWIELELPDAFRHNTYERVRDTLSLLADRQDDSSRVR